MSGCVTVVLREPGGATHKMLRWSGILPTVLSDPRLFADDPSGWVEDFMREWYRMADDYEKHKRDGQYELDMTPVYLPWNEAAPSEYGIVCIDLRQRTILSMQTFCSEPVAISLLSLRADARRAKSAETLILGGIVSHLHVRPQGQRKWTSYDLPADQPQRAAAFREIAEMAQTFKGDGYLPISPPGFTITGFREGLDHALAFKQAMSDLGFGFSRKENRLWAEWVDRFLYDEPDEVALSWKTKFTGGVVEPSCDDDEDDVAEADGEFAM